MEENKIVPTEALGQKTRRVFVKTAAQVAVTAPAVAMLLTASTKQAGAQVAPIYGLTVGDDGRVFNADDSFQDDTFLVPGDDNVPTTGA